jgi:hypothetical protein
MKIIDINGRPKNAMELKIIQHNVTEAVTGDSISVPYVEAKIHGRSGRQWTEWYPVDEFEALNPDIELVHDSSKRRDL